LPHLKHDLDPWKQLISYKEIDALDIPNVNEFDLVVFKSILGGIAKGENNDLVEKVLNQIYKCLKKDGYLFFSENLEATSLHMYMRNRFSWGKEGEGWHYLSTNDILNLADIGFKKINSTTKGFLGCLGRNEFQRNILGNIDKLFLEALLPDKYKYIFFGVFQKR